ncbi:hypothetical protein MKX03_004502 [Papaver bracteatum]|nr:hypothetical protein MKX03_004502 [Papaver bracteatum]
MAMRVILTKISPFASSEASSLGFIEGFGVDLKEDMTVAELDEFISSASSEDLRKVNWNKYSKNKLTFAETRTESTKEIERLVRKMMLDEMDKKKKKFEDREEKRIDDEMRKGN